MLLLTVHVLENLVHLNQKLCFGEEGIFNKLFEDYMTEIDYCDVSDASGVGAIDKALPGKMHGSFKDATGDMKSTSRSIIVRPENY